VGTILALRLVRADVLHRTAACGLPCLGGVLEEVRRRGTGLLGPGEGDRRGGRDQDGDDTERDLPVASAPRHLALELDTLTPGLLLAFGLGQTLLRSWVGHIWAPPGGGPQG
jgi:hypothetical protein